MREKFKFSIKFCGTQTVLSPGTASLGWLADALAPCFLLAPRLFHRDTNLHCLYLDLLPSRSFTVTRSSLPLTGTGKKRVTATQTAPNQTAGPLGFTYCRPPGLIQKLHNKIIEMRIQKLKNMTLRLQEYKYSIVLIVVLISFNSCSHISESKMNKRIIKQYKHNPDSSISLNTFMSFKWDKVYVFGFPTTLENMNKTLGFSYPYYKEFCNTIVFLQNNQIVYHEENHTNVEKIENGEVIFKYPDSLNFACYKPANAIFKISKISLDRGFYYELEQIK
jgi:hypothetical protein